MIKFIKGRFIACVYAFKGLLLLVKEPSIIVQLMIFAFLIGSGFFFKISKQDWLIQLLLVGVVLGLESLNTAIERLADHIEPNYNKTIGIVKDLAAGAVAIAVLIGLVMLTIIYTPYISDYVQSN